MSRRYRYDINYFSKTGNTHILISKDLYTTKRIITH